MQFIILEVTLVSVQGFSRFVFNHYFLRLFRNESIVYKIIIKDLLKYLTYEKNLLTYFFFA